MDNASKALYMAGSLLIALLVISLLVYAFSNIGGLQDEVDTIESEEEITAFNTEYEAFNKKIMYGVDVISCINKVINHDEKYVNGKRSNPKYGTEALINVIVNLSDNNLHEITEVYHFDENGRERKYYGKDTEETMPLGNNALLSGNEFAVGGLYDLVSKSNEIEYVIENTDEKTKTDVEGWSYKKVTTYLADFKKRKFYCESMKYSEKTGLVNEIVFSEK